MKRPASKSADEPPAKNARPVRKKVKVVAPMGEDDESASIDVQQMLVNHCNEDDKQLMEHAKEQCDALRDVFDRTKRAILNGILAEKENAEGGEVADTNVTATAYDVIVKCTTGPYKGNSYVLKINTDRQRTCLIGRSTGRKFRCPQGLSLPKDPEISTTHAELRMEPDGMVFFVDLDSTNGSYVNDEAVDPHEPHLISATESTTIFVGGSQLQFMLVRSAAAEGSS